MPLGGLEATSSSPEKQGFLAERGQIPAHAGDRYRHGTSFCVDGALYFLVSASLLPHRIKGHHTWERRCAEMFAKPRPDISRFRGISCCPGIAGARGPDGRPRGPASCAGPRGRGGDPGPPGPELARRMRVWIGAKPPAVAPRVPSEPSARPTSSMGTDHQPKEKINCRRAGYIVAKEEISKGVPLVGTMA